MKYFNIIVILQSLLLLFLINYVFIIIVTCAIIISITIITMTTILSSLHHQSTIETLFTNHSFPLHHFHHTRWHHSINSSHHSQRGSYCHVIKHSIPWRHGFQFPKLYRWNEPKWRSFSTRINSSFLFYLFIDTCILGSMWCGRESFFIYLFNLYIYYVMKLYSCSVYLYDFCVFFSVFI